MSMNRKQKKLGRRVVLFLILAALLMLIGIFAEYLMPNDPNATNAAFMKTSPCKEFPFGTDKLGRCVCSRVLSGTCVSVFSSLALVGISLMIGTFMGMLCGYYGGVFDVIVMRIADVFLSFPQMVLAIAVAGILGGGLLNAMLALGITSWTLYARLARSAVLRLKKEDYLLAAEFTGANDLKILIFHVLPNIAGPLLVSAATQIGTTMMEIAGLSFLGVGVIPPQAEWGSMINEARAYLQLAPWAVLAPSAAIIVTVIIFNCLGDALRDWTDRNGQYNG